MSNGFFTRGHLAYISDPLQARSITHAFQRLVKHLLENYLPARASSLSELTLNIDIDRTQIFWRASER
jgi:hypothetical protein